MLAAFIATAFATLVTICVGYITDSLDSAELNFIDTKVVALLRKWLHLSTLNNRNAQTQRAKDLRSEGLLRFILTFSDQQLVTGIGLLIATFAKRCTITGNDFQTAAALAWFSSMTHLATLSVLRLYFMRRPRVRLVRLIAMVVVLGLLLAAEFVPAIGVWDPTLPLQCSIASQSTLYSGLSSPMSYESSEGELVLGFGTPLSNPLTATWLMFYLSVAYGNKVVSLYHNNPSLTFNSWLLGKLRKRAGVADPTDYEVRAKIALEKIDGTARTTYRTKVYGRVYLSVFFSISFLNPFYGKFNSPALVLCMASWKSSMIGGLAMWK